MPKKHKQKRKAKPAKKSPVAKASVTTPSKPEKVHESEPRSLLPAQALWKRRSRLFVRWVAGPALLYLVIFFLTQPHYLTHFRTGFYLDAGDGFQNVWNIWWVNKALVAEHASPYFTNMVHWPHGTTLLPQTMNIINAFMAIPLMHLFGFSLIEATNFAVLFAFAFSGVTMFWFIQKLYRNYWVGIVAGGLFTFSTYHMAHAQGHLQLVTFQFIPLFLLAFWTLIEKMRYRYAMGAALALFLVLLSDYYYLFWSVMVGGLWVLWSVYRKDLKLTKQNLKVLAAFAALAAMLVGPMVLKLTQLNNKDPLLGFHNPRVFVLDPLAVIIPGGSWYWSSLTSWHWQHLPFMSEVSVFFGFGLLMLLAIAFVRSFIHRKGFKPPRHLNFWWIVLFTFAVLALGERLTVFGIHSLDRVPMPYVLMERLFPTLQISGMPVRWVLISLIAAIVIGSYLLSLLDMGTRKGKVLLGLFIAVSVFDLWPIRLPLTMPQKHSEPYVHALRKLPSGAVIDNGADSEAEQLFHQTIHEKPIAFGYVTRLPRSVGDKDFHIFAALEQGRYNDICRVHYVRYVTTPASRPYNKVSFPVVYRDKQTLIYDFKNAPGC